jgi:hypothetical protein
VDAREMAEGISEGINALSALVTALDGSERAVDSSELATDEVSSSLDVMEQALAALIDSQTIVASFRPRAEDLHRVRRLRQLVADWRETGGPALEVTALAEECLALASAWR